MRRIRLFQAYKWRTIEILYRWQTLLFQIGQGNIGLEDRNYYVNETNVTKAYRQFIQDLSLALTNDTSMIDNDVTDIFEFEQEIAKVNLALSYILFASFLFHSTIGR